MDRAVITVDGLAGSGKTTLSRMLAERLGFIHFGSSLFYRSLAYLALKEGVPQNDAAQLVLILKRHSIELSFRADKKATVLIDGVDCGDLVRTPEVSEATSITSAIPEVRSALYEAQRNVFSGKSLVAEGRDMGTIIFPDAQVKFFIEASIEVRMRRRLAELYPGKSMESLDSDAVCALRVEIVERDERDSKRAVAPAVAAADAIIIDNSSEMLTRVLENMYYAVTSRGIHPVRH